MALNTLKKSRQFRTCYSRGRKIVCGHAVVFYYKNPDGDGLHIGVVASKRVGGAVKRNRAKRLLREAARAIADKWNNPDLWVVLIARGSLPSVNSNEATADIERALAAAGLPAETPIDRQTK